jgi:hypothetical protein
MEDYSAASVSQGSYFPAFLGNGFTMGRRNRQRLALFCRVFAIDHPSPTGSSNVAIYTS